MLYIFLFVWCTLPIFLAAMNDDPHNDNVAAVVAYKQQQEYKAIGNAIVKRDLESIKKTNISLNEYQKKELRDLIQSELNMASYHVQHGTRNMKGICDLLIASSTGVLMSTQLLSLFAWPQCNQEQSCTFNPLGAEQIHNWLPIIFSIVPFTACSLRTIFNSSAYEDLEDIQLIESTFNTKFNK